MAEEAEVEAFEEDVVDTTESVVKTPSVLFAVVLMAVLGAETTRPGNDAQTWAWWRCVPGPGICFEAGPRT